MAKRYRMTPRRREALRKAQIASARKRRRRGFGQAARTAGTVAGGIVASAVVWHATNYAHNPGLAVKHGRSLHGSAKKRFSKSKSRDPNAPGVGNPVRRRPIGYYQSNRSARASMGRRISTGQRSRLR